MKSNTAFAERSRNVVRNFLSTAVVVDDRVYLSDGEAIVIPDKTDLALRAPGRQAGNTDVSVNISVANAAEAAAPEPTTSTDSAHTLNGKQLIDAFAKAGILCSVIKPTKEELDGLTGTLQNLLPVADVVVLDWVLCGDQLGSRPIELIKQFASVSDRLGSRLRLVLVYTGERDLQQIAEKLRTSLGNDARTAEGDPYSVELPGTKIVVYGKSNQSIPGEVNDRRLEPVALPETVVCELAEMTSGLLANAAMSSISAIRNNAYQLLSKFSRDLDPAFVTQSVLICPEKASEQIVPVIAAEVQSILEDSHVDRLLEVAHIREWLDARQSEGKLTSTKPEMASDVFRNGIDALVTDGIRKEAKADLAKTQPDFSKAFVSNSLHNRLTELLSISDEERKGDIRLANLMSLRTRYQDVLPPLTLGTIVSEVRQVEGKPQTDYWLCIQPVCDCVRLKEAQRFPFLPLTLLTSHEKNSVILGEADPLFLKAGVSPSLISMRTFAPTQDEQVIPQDLNGKRVYMDSEGTEFEWRGELKALHAQRVAHEASSAMSRVGLYESEWNRLG